MVSTLRLLLNAVSSTECLLQRIEIGMGGAIWPSSSQWREAHSIRQEKRPSTMPAEELHLDLHWHRIAGRADEVTPQLLPLIVENTSKSLKRFSLRSDCDPHCFGGNPLEGVALEDWYEGLEEISLIKLCIREQQMRDFLRVQKASLKRLTLSELVLIGDWDRLLSWVSRNFALEQFTLDRAYALKPHRWNEINNRAYLWYNTGLQCQTRAEMCHGLDLFISSQAAARQAEEERKRKEIEQQEIERASRRSSRLSRTEGQKHYQQ